MMEKRNMAFIAASIDGYIADKNGGLDWLYSIPNPDNNDMGFAKFMEKVDALVMGRTTFETVCGFDIEWPYNKPVFVLSNTLQTIPEKFTDKAFLVKGSLNKVLEHIHKKGFARLYIDGGKTIQNFLKEDLIDEICISTIPVILGEGIPLFTKIPVKLDFEYIESEVYLNAISQNYYRRKR